VRVAYDDDVTPEQVGQLERLVAPEFTRGIWIDAVARDAVIEECAANLAGWYPDNASTSAFCAALRSMKSTGPRS
jgi:hypothetical protein